MADLNGAAAEAQRGFWNKLKQGLSRTHSRFVGQVGGALEGAARFDDEARARLEEALLGADLGVATAELLLERLEARIRRGGPAASGRLRGLLAEEIARLLEEVPQPPEPRGPMVTLVVGVNGAGKTTSIAKLAARSQARGRRVLLGAGDTFRAAAIDQLALWGERLGVEVIRQAPGSGPRGGGVRRRAGGRRRAGVDDLIVDTAGRLHNKEHLMAELAKIRRVVEREAPRMDPFVLLLVLDATTGQNALHARRGEFLRAGERRRRACWPSSTAPPRGAWRWRSGASCACRCSIFGVGERPTTSSTSAQGWPPLWSTDLAPWTSWMSPGAAAPARGCYRTSPNPQVGAVVVGTANSSARAGIGRWAARTPRSRRCARRARRRAARRWW